MQCAESCSKQTDLSDFGMRTAIEKNLDPNIDGFSDNVKNLFEEFLETPRDVYVGYDAVSIKTALYMYYPYKKHLAPTGDDKSNLLNIHMQRALDAKNASKNTEADADKANVHALYLELRKDHGGIVFHYESNPGNNLKDFIAENASNFVACVVHKPVMEKLLALKAHQKLTPLLKSLSIIAITATSIEIQEGVRDADHVCPAVTQATSESDPLSDESDE